MYHLNDQQHMSKRILVLPTSTQYANQDCPSIQYITTQQEVLKDNKFVISRILFLSQNLYYSIYNTKTLIYVKCFYVRALKLSPPVHPLNATITIVIITYMFMMGLENQPSECILHLASYIISYKRSISFL